MIFGGRQRQEDKGFQEEALVHLDAIFYAARYMTRDAQEAEDLVQETFLKAFRFWHRYQKGTNCKAWLFRILTNTHINRNRGKVKQFTFLDNVDIEPAGAVPISDVNAFYKSPEAGYLHQLLHDDVVKAIEALPEDFRIPVILADLQDFSYQEIADIMECPIGTVMSRLHRGRKALRKKLRRYAEDAGYIQSEEEAGAKKPTSLADYRAKRTASAS